MKKKFHLVVTACLFSLLSLAQIKKGTVVGHFNVGDLRSISLENNSSGKNNNLSFNPGVGYFIKNNWEIGVGINYNSFRYSANYGNYSQRSNTIGIKAYSNYYFGKRKLKPYFSFQTGWYRGQGNYTTNGVKTDLNNTNFYTGIGGGLNWHISPKVALFTEANYIKNNPFGRDGHDGLNLTIGVRLFFGNKKKN